MGKLIGFLATLFTITACGLFSIATCYKMAWVPELNAWIDSLTTKEEPAQIIVEPEALAEPEPQPVVIDEPEPEPEPVFKEPEGPKIVDVTIKDLSEAKNMWPKKLELAKPFPIKTTFRRTQGGEAIFHKGSVIEVIKLNPDGSIEGSLMGFSMSLPINYTNLLEWFEATHSDRFKMKMPETLPTVDRPEMSPDDRVRFSADFKRWCLRNTRAKTLDYSDDAIVVEVEALKQGTAHLRENTWNMTAGLISKTYLEMLRKSGGTDNYANCNVINEESGEILGTAAHIMP